MLRTLLALATLAQSGAAVPNELVALAPNDTIALVRLESLTSLENSLGAFTKATGLRSVAASDLQAAVEQFFYPEWLQSEACEPLVDKAMPLFLGAGEGSFQSGSDESSFYLFVPSSDPVGLEEASGFLSGSGRLVTSEHYLFFSTGRSVSAQRTYPNTCRRECSPCRSISPRWFSA